MRVRRAAIGATYLIPPTITMLVALPFVTGNWLFYPGGQFESLIRDFSMLHLPFYLGAIAAPGYISLVFREITPVAPTTRRWFRLSLLLALVTSAAGTVLGAVAIFPPIGVPSLLTCIQSLHLLYRFQKGRQPPAHRASAIVGLLGSVLFLIWFFTGVPPRS